MGAFHIQTKMAANDERRGVTPRTRATMLAGRGRLRQPSVASCVGSDGWATSVFASPALLMSELPQTLKVGAGLRRPQEPAELVRLDFDKLNGVPSFNELIILLAREIEPFIVGV